MAAERLAAAEGRSIRIARCALCVGAQAWPFAEAHEREIAAHWKRAVAERPKLFDGTVYMLGAAALKQDAFCGTLLATDFKSFLYWRDHDFPDRSVRDAFGSAVIRSSEGHVLLGRQTSGNLNAGFAYPPGGFIDGRDVSGGAVDIEASIARELCEETGLEPGELKRAPGYLLTSAGTSVSIAIEWRSPLAAEDLRERMLSHIRHQPAPELADVVIVSRPDEIDAGTMPAYARSLLSHLLSA